VPPVAPDPLLPLLPPDLEKPEPNPFELFCPEVDGSDAGFIVAVGWHSIAAIDPGAALAQFTADCALTKLVVVSKNAALAAIITP
jgi:hypothetical protein